MNIKDAAILKSIKTGQTTLLQAIASTVQKLTLEQKAVMDEATYDDIEKSGNNYIIENILNPYSQTFETLNLGDLNGQDSWSGDVLWDVINTDHAGATGTQSILATSENSTPTISRTVLSYINGICIFYFKFNYGGGDGTANYIKAILKDGATAKITITWTRATTVIDVNSTSCGTFAEGTWAKVEVKFSGGNNIDYVKIDDVEKITNQAVTYTKIDVISLLGYSIGNQSNRFDEISFTDLTNIISGTIKSASITKDANIGLRYWGDTMANLVAGAAGSTIAAKICDSAGTPLHSNFVTIASSEYARIPLERPVVLTASSGGQTVWDFTSLSNADAFINELGVLAKALIVELALDGTNYTVLKEVTNFNEDIINILAPRITLVSGMGVVNGTSKLRATYIVNISLSNTTIKLQVQLNRLAVGDTSPSIQPFVGDATKYVGAGQVAII